MLCTSGANFLIRKFHFTDPIRINNDPPDGAYFKAGSNTNAKARDKRAPNSNGLVPKIGPPFITTRRRRRYILSLTNVSLCDSNLLQMRRKAGISIPSQIEGHFLEWYFLKPPRALHGRR
jgi:hypothetical protein